jgi:diguanylate cyclase (GGDEF)-like protein
MAADEETESFPPAPPGAFDWPGAGELDERLSEEIGRAERYGTSLSCLLVVVDNLEEMAGEHGGELREQTMAYIAGALRSELRRFDRVGMPTDRELLIVLPGADGPRGEMVARRVLDRLRAIKVEARGRRRALRISVGLAAWRPQATPAAMVDRARAAAARPTGNGAAAGGQPAGAGEDPDSPFGEAAHGEPTAPPS